MAAPQDLEAQFRARSFAMLIGVDRYQFEGGALPTLKCAVSDVGAISRALVNVGGFPRENILLLTNEEATRARISAAFGQLRLQIERLRRERSSAKTRFLFYFSGHGLIGTTQGADRTFLATFDTDPNNPGFTGLGWNDLDDLIATNIAPDQHLRLIDCCHAAGLAPGAKGGKKLTIEFVVDAVARTEGQGVLFSCQRDELAWERREGNLSVFATALVDGLNGAAPDTHGIVYLSSLVDYLADRVPADAMKERGVRQTPVAKLDQIRGPMPIGFRGASIRATQDIVTAGLSQLVSLKQSGALSTEEATFCENLAARWILPKDEAEMERVRVLIGFFLGQTNLPTLKTAVQAWIMTPVMPMSPNGGGARGPSAEPAMSEAERAFMQRMAMAQAGQTGGGAPVAQPMPQLPPHGYPQAPQVPPHQGYPHAPTPPMQTGYPHAAQPTPPPYMPYPAHPAPAPSKSTTPHPLVVLAAAIFAVGIVAIFVVAGYLKKQKDDAKLNPVPTAGSAPGVAEVLKPCPDDMVLIQGGTFLMGSNTGLKNEQPAHKEQVDSFCMHTFEVTTAQYRACGASGKCKPDPQEITPQVDSSCNLRVSTYENHPVNCVKQTNAAAYCATLGGRLPTEREWEYAAKGGIEDRAYPWGATPPTSTTANGCGPECKSFVDNFNKSLKKPLKFALLYTEPDAAVLTAPGGTFADASRWGVRDMAGNVSEWTATYYCAYDDKQCKGTKIATRGGSWFDWDGTAFKTSARWEQDSNMMVNYLGFRCARNVNISPAAPK
jgi:formylglycine-generating enzyme required for sulfatase activity